MPARRSDQVSVGKLDGKSSFHKKENSKDDNHRRPSSVASGLCKECSCILQIITGILVTTLFATAVTVPIIISLNHNKNNGQSTSTRITNIIATILTTTTNTSVTTITTISSASITSTTTSVTTITNISSASTTSTTITTMPSTSTITNTSKTTTTTSTTSTTESTSETTSTTASTSTSETTTITTTTTTTPLVNPCLSGLYWNVTGVVYAGNGTAGSALNQLSSPTGIFIDKNDTLYINDQSNYRVVSYLRDATSGNIVAGIGASGSALNQFSTSIRFNYVDANENIYITDTNNNRVMRWTSGGSTGVVVAGNNGAGAGLNQLNSPYGVWVDSSSNVFVTEYSNQRVTKWASGASAGVVVAGITGSSGSPTNKLSSPAGLYYDEVNQNLYISNAGTAATVMKWRVGDSNGTIIAGLAGNSGSNSSQLNIPTGIILDQWQNLYVNDRANLRIQLFCNGSSTGITIAGSGSGGSSFSIAYDVTLDSQLNLYVVDNGANRVIKFFKL